MATGIIIHVNLDTEKRTEIFSEEIVRIGSDETCELQIHTGNDDIKGVWLEIRREGTVYRVFDLKKELHFTINSAPLLRYKNIDDGDSISSTIANVSFSFFALQTQTSLITTNREQRHFAQFIEEAALESSYSPKPDEAKAFLREFIRELLREISWTTKLMFGVLLIGILSGFFYLGLGFYRELIQNRKQSEEQNETIKHLEEKLNQTGEQLTNLDKTNKDLLRNQSLVPNLRLDYGNGVCLIVGVYDLVDRRNGKPLRYPDPLLNQTDPYEPNPAVTEDGMPETPPASGLTTEGNGTLVEYDFIGTGFHVGNGFILTNRHVLQPWNEDDMIKQMIKQSNGRARVKRLVVYFPNLQESVPLKVQQIGGHEDLGVGVVDLGLNLASIPVLPLDDSTDSVAVGKMVVTMGYPNGPDRLLAMVDDNEAKTINARFGNSRQALLNYLAVNKKIVPLTTQGAVTDLDSKRIVHDARTAEGGSGAPLFGQSGKVIGVNFGIFTENTAANMAIPIKFGIDLLKKAGWQQPDVSQADQTQPSTSASTNSNSGTKVQ